MAAQARAREQAQAYFRQQLKVFELSDVTFTDEKLGGGAYGYVLVVNLNGVRRAAKILHEGLVKEVNFDDIERRQNRPRSFIESFKNECILLSEISHPNIVQFFGICHLKGATFPALVMELLMSSLHDYLEKREISLPAKISILIDISQGLVYLHGKNIIHRDLTATNILLTESLTAKIADLGMARILADRTNVAKMTMVPGNPDYMPPEATDGNQYSATYGKPIDSFSMGNIILFTVTQKYPELLAPKYFDFVTGKNEARSEIQRRGESIHSMCVLLGNQHPIIQLAKQCLQDDPQSRPSSVEIMLQLQNQALKQQNATIQKEKDGMSIELSHTIEKLQQSTLQNKSLKQENADLKKDKESISAELLHCKRTLKHLQNLNSAHTNDCRSLNGDLKQANVTLAQKIAEAYRTSHRLQEVSAQLYDYQNKYHELLEEKETLLEKLQKQEELLEEKKTLSTSEHLPNLPTLDPPSPDMGVYTDNTKQGNMADFENRQSGYKPSAKPRKKLSGKSTTSRLLPDSPSSLLPDSPSSLLPDSPSSLLPDSPSSLLPDPPSTETISKPNTNPLTSSEQRKCENSLPNNDCEISNISSKTVKLSANLDTTRPGGNFDCSKNPDDESNNSEDNNDMINDLTTLQEYSVATIRFKEHSLPPVSSRLRPIRRRRLQAICQIKTHSKSVALLSAEVKSDVTCSPQLGGAMHVSNSERYRSKSGTNLNKVVRTKNSEHSTTRYTTTESTSLDQGSFELSRTYSSDSAWACQHCTNIVFDSNVCDMCGRSRNKRL